MKNLGKQKTTILSILALLFIVAMLIWHVQTWHSSGKYAEMSTWIGSSKGALTVIYDLAIIFAFSGGLALLYKKIHAVFFDK